MKNADYWKQRFSQLETAQHSIGASAIPEIEKIYRAAEKELEGKIAVWYQRFADNNGISMSDAKQYLTGANLKEFKWDVQEYIKYGKENALTGQWMKELENASAKYHITKLEALKLQTKASLQKVYAQQLGITSSTLQTALKSGYYHSAFEIQKGFNIGWDIAGLDQTQIEQLLARPWAADGYNFSDRIWNSKEKLIAQIHQDLTQGVMLGKDPQKTIDSISKKMGTSKYNAGRLVMTEEAYFSSVAQKKCFEELGVEEYEIVATLDSITSPICRSLDGKVYSMKDFEAGVTAPPFHVNCRSTTAPYFDENFGQIGERAARDETTGEIYYVPDDIKYPEWENTFVNGGDKSGFDVISDPLNGATSYKRSKPQSNSSIEPGLKTIEDCKTIADVVSFMQDQDWFLHRDIKGKPWRSDGEMSLDGVDLPVAKSIYKTHEQLFTRYPAFKNQLCAIKSDKLDGMTYANCVWGFGNGGITVNTRWFGDEAKLIKSFEHDLASGFHPTGVKYDSIVMHELGHAIDDYLTNSLQIVGFNGWKPKAVSAYLRPKVMKAAGFKVKDTAKQVSQYATMNAMEWFAECFCEWMCSDNPRAVAKEFGKQLEELMKGRGLL